MKKIKGTGEEIKIRLMVPDDEDDFLDFMKHNLGESDKFITYWDWRNNSKYNYGKETAVIVSFLVVLVLLGKIYDMQEI